MSSMTFESLPANIKELPLTDRRLAADVIDLIISAEARADGCLGIVVCDERGRALEPIVLTDIPHDGEATPLASLLRHLLPIAAEQQRTLLLGRGRPRGGVPNDLDRAWHQQAIDSCAAHGVPLLGFYLATRDGVFPLPAPLAAAS